MGLVQSAVDDCLALNYLLWVWIQELQKEQTRKEPFLFR